MGKNWKWKRRSRCAAVNGRAAGQRTAAKRLARNANLKTLRTSLPVSLLPSKLLPRLRASPAASRASFKRGANSLAPQLSVIFRMPPRWSALGLTGPALRFSSRSADHKLRCQLALCVIDAQGLRIARVLHRQSPVAVVAVTSLAARANASRYRQKTSEFAWSRKRLIRLRPRDTIQMRYASRNAVLVPAEMRWLRSARANASSCGHANKLKNHYGGEEGNYSCVNTPIS